MRISWPRTDFLIVEDYFSPEQAVEWLAWILRLGQDRERGFRHPDLKPNRFHAAPKYPVKKYMCLGLYWNPEDYAYYRTIPATAAKPFPIPPKIRELCAHVLTEFYPHENFSPEAVMVNFYTRDSSMGLHVDKDEENHEAPVIGLNFGSSCRFFFEDERGERKDVRIPGNSLYVFGKSARLMRHGLGSIYAKTLAPGAETFLADKERVNLTIRQVY